MKGDSLRTHLADRSVVEKTDERIKGVGEIDEANAFIGLARVSVDDEEIKGMLLEIQKMMFKAGSQVVGGEEKIGAEDLDVLKKFEAELLEKVTFPRSFIILEKDEASAYLSVARAVVRRAERKVVELCREGYVDRALVDWLNKLSYVLYLMILKVQGGDYLKV